MSCLPSQQFLLNPGPEYLQDLIECTVDLIVRAVRLGGIGNAPVQLSRCPREYRAIFSGSTVAYRNHEMEAAIGESSQDLLRACPIPMPWRLSVAMDFGCTCPVGQFPALTASYCPLPSWLIMASAIIGRQEFPVHSTSTCCISRSNPG
jgi:hypothetical protein